ncbi:MAG: helix-turn-helix transcriptional regulator [Gemmatimonadaceae bacterium]
METTESYLYGQAGSDRAVLDKKEWTNMVTNEEKIPKLLTTTQLAEATGVSRWRIFELCRQGKAPPHMRVGNTLRFPEPGVLAWIAEQCNTSHREK